MTLLPIRLSPGQDLRRALEDTLQAEHHTDSAFVVAGIGSLVDAQLRYAGETAETRLAGPLEIVSLAGSLSAAGAHLHMAVSDANGRVSGGHVAYGNIVRTTAELLLAPLPAGTLTREHDPRTGFLELQVRTNPSPGHLSPTSLPRLPTMIRNAQPNDAAAIVEIYNHYVLTTTITFEEQPVAAAQMAERIAEVQAAALPWLVAERDGQVAGYAYASKWKPRSAYRHSVECSVYLDRQAVGGGVGSRLYEALFADLKSRGLHVVIGGIALPNESSIALHEKFGLKKVAQFEQVGFKFGRWVDVGYWQKTL